jgi:hypothetical protein
LHALNMYTCLPDQFGAENQLACGECGIASLPWEGVSSERKNELGVTGSRKSLPNTSAFSSVGYISRSRIANQRYRRKRLCFAASSGRRSWRQISTARGGLLCRASQYTELLQIGIRNRVPCDGHIHQSSDVRHYRWLVR